MAVDTSPPRLFVVAAGGPARLDQALAAAWPDLSRSRLQALIRDGRVAADGRIVTDPAWRPVPAIRLTLGEPAPAAASPRPQDIPLDIVFEDDDLVVLDKPAGLVVHPGAGHQDGTLVNALLHRCGASLSGIGGVLRPGIVHRLDKDTSGLLVVAKTDRAHRGLADQFADHGRTGPLAREYLAFAWGAPVADSGSIAAPIARSPGHREKMAVTVAGRGRDAVTHYALEQRFGPADNALASRLRCRLETGRTHQIRVHLAHLRHPLIGDDVYGAGFRTMASRLSNEAREAVDKLRRQALHATLLSFAHPRTGAMMRFESRLPSALAALEAALSALPSRADPSERRRAR